MINVEGFALRVVTQACSSMRVFSDQINAGMVVCDVVDEESCLPADVVFETGNGYLDIKGSMLAGEIEVLLADARIVEMETEDYQSTVTNYKQGDDVPVVIDTGNYQVVALMNNHSCSGLEIKDDRIQLEWQQNTSAADFVFIYPNEGRSNGTTDNGSSYIDLAAFHIFLADGNYKYYDTSETAVRCKTEVTVTGTDLPVKYFSDQKTPDNGLLSFADYVTECGSLDDALNSAVCVFQQDNRGGVKLFKNDSSDWVISIKTTIYTTNLSYVIHRREWTKLWVSPPGMWVTSYFSGGSNEYAEQYDENGEVINPTTSTERTVVVNGTEQAQSDMDVTTITQTTESTGSYSLSDYEFINGTAVLKRR